MSALVLTQAKETTMAIRTFHSFASNDTERVVPANTDVSRFEGPTVVGQYADGTPHEGYHEIRFEGAVLGEYERNFYDDSDFIAVVWNERTQSVQEIEYASTRGWTYANGCGVDATPEVIAKAEAWAAARNLASLQLADEALAKDPAVKGKTVKVVSGRPTCSTRDKSKGEDVAQGTIGEVFWVGQQATYTHWQRKYGRPAKRVGVRTADGRTFFTTASNVEVVGYEQYLHAPEVLAVRANHNPLYTYRCNLSVAAGRVPML